MITIEGLTYSYPGAERPALTDFSLDVSEGELVGILGPNGSGKSTLCYAIAGFLPSYFRGDVSGSLQVGGLDPIALGPSSLVGTVGFVFQDPFSQITGARFSVREEVAFGLENLAVPREEMGPRVEDALRMAGLTHLADRSPFELSGGEQQRLALASVLALQPKVLILDEPTSQLDPHGARQVMEAVDRLTTERK
ncbi:MAG: ABC transporter ATP-binding protein, partial [Anaerolineales bacterium]